MGFIMFFFKNHISCRDDKYTKNGNYDCSYSVSIDDDQFDKQNNFDSEDLKKITITKEFINEIEIKKIKERNKNKKIQISDEDIISSCTYEILILLPEVEKWLNDNIADRKGYSINKGWYVASFQYRINDENEIVIYFHRKNDAMNFIKKFSKYKNPTIYYDYFKSKLKILDLKTMKYIDQINYEKNNQTDIIIEEY